MLEVIALTGINLFLTFVFMITLSQKDKAFETERVRWEEERKDLCSRIQARDYPEYNLGEVRKIKAEKQERDPMQGIEIV
jgi:hypothetical protein